MNKHPQAKPGPRDATGSQGRHDRLDAIEQADNRTEHLNPGRGSVSTDPVEDMLEAAESNADYKDEANRVTPVQGPPDQSGNV
ncbi:hypothetical protein [Frateuria sp. STR12]|uniref:hypothetical protein n=1 Tax=Frateuria hangzhouensis TaxID=2995589 RepID=UPI0022609F55|nr:hypothetical protein [Frateuria sp. STR12]MCX7513104.1 hypothetical protein [Frateuria sp. STR12]